MYYDLWSYDLYFVIIFKNADSIVSISDYVIIDIIFSAIWFSIISNNKLINNIM